MLARSLICCRCTLMSIACLERTSIFILSILFCIAQGTFYLKSERNEITNKDTRVNLKIPPIRRNRCSFGVVVGVRAQHPLWPGGPFRLSPSIAALTRNVTRPQTAIRHSAHFADAHAHPLSLSFAFVSPRSKIRHYQTAAAAAAREEPNNEPILRHPENGK